MIDLKDLRDNPEKYRKGVRDKQMNVQMVEDLLKADELLRTILTEKENLTAEKNRIGKEIGQLAGSLKKAQGGEKADIEAKMKSLQARPHEIKEREGELAELVKRLETERDQIWLKVPQPADPDVPVGAGAEDNREISRWSPAWFDPARSFEENRGFKPRTHLELGQSLGLFDFERGVKMGGSRSYVLRGAGMELHMAVLRMATDFMVYENGFEALSVPVLVRDGVMTGTGFFPAGREQAYEVNETARGGGQDMYLTGTGEVGLMGFHQDEILEPEALPRKYVTVSTCFRREAGAAGKDTAGLYRIHQFDKVEQVVICRADEAESRRWHTTMIGYVQKLLMRLEIPHRLLQCCTGDLGPKNVDMIDIESWMPSRGDLDEQGRASGAYSETHSASRLYDYQCRRLGIRYRDPATKKIVIAHSLNNTVLASPRILIPILELYQNADGTITLPAALRPYMGGREKIG